MYLRLCFSSRLSFFTSTTRFAARMWEAMRVRAGHRMLSHDPTAPWRSIYLATCFAQSYLKIMCSKIERAELKSQHLMRDGSNCLVTLHGELILCDSHFLYSNGKLTIGLTRSDDSHKRACCGDDYSLFL